MKITKLTVWSVDLPLARPYSLSGGRLHFERLDSPIVPIDPVEGGARKEGGHTTASTEPGLGAHPVEAAMGDPVALHAGDA